MIKIIAAVLLLAVSVSAGCDENSANNANYCYAKVSSSGLGFYKCNCPWATCKESGNTYECKVTTEAIVIWVIGSLVGCCLIALCIFCCIKQCKCCCYRETNTATVIAAPTYPQPVAGQYGQAGVPQMVHVQKPEQTV